MSKQHVVLDFCSRRLFVIGAGRRSVAYVAEHEETIGCEEGKEDQGRFGGCIEGGRRRVEEDGGVGGEFLSTRSDRAGCRQGKY